jgi:hypothetical protein
MNISLVFGQIPGLPIPPLPPGLFWLTLTAGGLAFAVSKLFESANQRSKGEREKLAKPPPACSPQPPSEDIEVKLRKLASLKEENLISQEEYQRKREDIIAKW